MKNIFKLLFLLITITVSLTFFACGNNAIKIPQKNTDSESTESIELESKTENEIERNTETEKIDTETSECIHNYEEKILLDATCSKEGIIKKSCTLCKKIENIAIPKTKHTEVIDLAMPATCTTFGKTEGKHCSVCDAIILEQNPIEPLGHTEIIEPAIPATCTASGKSEGKYCGVCNAVIIAQTYIEPLGHKEIIDLAIPATCATLGKTEGKHCEYCNIILVPQTPISKLEHSEIKRTHTPVTCKNNGIVEIYCTGCNTVLNYETILSGHYSTEHEYAKITHNEIGALCKGYLPGDKCELCNTRFIAPGTYTIIGDFINITYENHSTYYTGKEKFKFEYSDKSNNSYTSNSIDISVDESINELHIEFDGERIDAFESLVITITEEYLAEVSDVFYNRVFLKYFESGEYNLSGKYTWNERIFNFIDIDQKIDFTYQPKNSHEKINGSQISVIKDLPVDTLIKGVISYNNFPEAIYFISDPGTEWGYYVEYEIDFGKQSQSVSKEFFEWFTYYAADKVAI